MVYLSQCVPVIKLYNVAEMNVKSEFACVSFACFLTKTCWVGLFKDFDWPQINRHMFSVYISGKAIHTFYRLFSYGACKVAKSMKALVFGPTSSYHGNHKHTWNPFAQSALRDQYSLIQCTILLPGSWGLPEELHGGDWPKLVDSPQCRVNGSWEFSLHVQRIFSPFALAVLLYLAAMSCRSVAVPEEG